MESVSPRQGKPGSLLGYSGNRGLFAHRLGGLEKDYETSAISTDPVNHQKMVITRQAKIDKIADYIPELEVIGDPDADLLIVGWGRNIRTPLRSNGNYAGAGKEGCSGSLQVHQSAA